MNSTTVFANATFEEILDDLSSRFIINVPEAELASVERICFQVEQAHWFYEDFIREIKPDLPSFQLKTFSARIFKHCPLLHQWAHEHERAYADFMQYRFRIPVCGAIILNTNLDKCVLVKGWSSKSGWGFPKGKINQDEDYDCCAIREVLEETGFDIGPLLKKSDYIELTMREQRIRLYIIQGVPEDTQFTPRTRKEISQISWIKLDDLPTYKAEPRHGNGASNYVKAGPYRFYMVVPFVSKLKHFVNQRKKTLRKANDKNKAASPRKSIQPSNLSSPKSNDSSDALKSLLGVDGIKFPTASPAVSQPHPSHPPPLTGTNLLQEIFSSHESTTEEQTNEMGAHRASIVEQLLKGNLPIQQQQQPTPSTSETVRRNSLLNVLQGSRNTESVKLDPIQALFQGNVQKVSDTTSMYSHNN